LNAFESILVYSPSWIGDAVMSLGALRSVKANYPSARITVLARTWVEDLYQGCEVVDGTLRYDYTGAHSGPRGFMRLVDVLKKPQFDMALLFPNAFRAAAVVWTARIPERWGYGTDGRGLLLTRSAPPAPRPFGRHQAFYYLDLLQGLGLSVSHPDTHLAVTPGMKEQAAALLSQAEWQPGDTLIGIHPGATGSSAKRWLAERYAEVGDRLASRHGVRVALLGGPKEIGLSNEIRSYMKTSPLFLAGETSLEALIGIIDSLCLLVTNDSGPMHLASALEVPTVAVFGPTDERETGPMGRHARVVRKHVDCSPCLLKECTTDHRCMRLVEVGEVYEEAVNLMESKAKQKTGKAAS
jgi:heptosyltransferase-2